MRKRHYNKIDEIDSSLPMATHRNQTTENKTPSDLEEPLDSIQDEAPLTTIHNLVGTCEILSSTMPIDLEHVSRCLPNSFYDRKRFAAITIRVTSPTCTALLFTSNPQPICPNT
jgi:TATA-box binding protein (TBP) (component of TFIID and TFIIIB)